MGQSRVAAQLTLLSANVPTTARDDRGKTAEEMARYRGRPAEAVALWDSFRGTGLQLADFSGVIEKQKYEARYRKTREAEARALQRASAKGAFLRRRKQGGPRSVSALEPVMTEVAERRAAALNEAQEEKAAALKEASSSEADAIWTDP
mmetsp:Transcript_15410/g.35750  ORF Transcript_15410/g.35750 Transcript_15410/m.35750 type:complete len:149 (+) Transcript_15410:474-920(+)